MIIACGNQQRKFSTRIKKKNLYLYAMEREQCRLRNCKGCVDYLFTSRKSTKTERAQCRLINGKGCVDYLFTLRKTTKTIR